jgi:hypothetical protein
MIPCGNESLVLLVVGDPSSEKLMSLGFGELR